MTHREAFEKVKSHLRAPGGLKCAIGCLIPDEEYLEEFDDGSLIFFQVVEKVPSLAGLNLVFLSRLQGIHDGFRVESWPAKLEEAEAYFKAEGWL